MGIEHLFLINSELITDRDYKFQEIGPRKIQEQYPIIGPGNLVAEVVQGNFGITEADDEKPIIATAALFTCIGLLGYEQRRRIGFLMHIQPSDSVERGIERLYQELAVAYPDVEKEFATHIVASTFHDFRKYIDLEEALRGNPSRSGTTLRFVSSIGFVPDFKREEGKPGEGVALDTRDGQILAYLRDTVREGPCEFRYNKPMPCKFF